MLQIRKNGVILTLLSAACLLLFRCDSSPVIETSQSFNLSDPDKKIHIIFRNKNEHEYALQPILYVRCSFCFSKWLYHNECSANCTNIKTLSRFLMFLLYAIINSVFNQF